MSQQNPNQQESHNLRPRATSVKPDDIGSKTADVFDGVAREIGEKYIKPGVTGLLEQIWHAIGTYIFRTISNGGVPPAGGISGGYSSGNGQPSYKYGHQNYGSYYQSKGPSGYADPSGMRRSDRVRWVKTWPEAMAVKAELEAALDAYPNITVEDFYAVTPSENPEENRIDYQTGKNWGWYDISTMQIKQAPNGLVEIVMPRPVPLNK